MEKLMETIEKFDPKEISYNYKLADGLLNRIANQVNAGTSNKVAQLAYLIAFVHPEVKDIAMGIQSGTKAQTIREAPLNLLKYSVGDNLPNDIDMHPMVKVLDEYRAGVLMYAMDAGPRGAGESEDTSNFAASQFARDVDEMRKSIDNSRRYTTEAIIDSRIKNASGQLKESLLELKEKIDFSSLFGYTRDTVPGDGIRNPDDPESVDRYYKSQDANWNKLVRLEHWFYYVITDLKQAKERSSATDTAESLYTFIPYFRELLKNPAVAEYLQDVSDVYGGVTGAIGEIARGNLASDENLPQLAAIILMWSGRAGSSSTPLAIRIADALLEKEGYNTPEKKETYAAAVNAICDLRDAPLGKDGGSLKVQLGQWHPSQINEALTEVMNSTEGNEDASTLSMELNVKGGIPLCDAVKGIRAQFMPNLKDTMKLAVGAIIGLVAEQDGIERGLVKDPEHASPDIGVAPKTDLTEEEKAAMQAGKTPRQLSEEFLSKVRPIVNKPSSTDSNDVQTSTEAETFKIEPSDTVDVTGANVLPRFAIPLFAVNFPVPKTNNPTDEKLYQAGTLLATYMTIASTDNGIGNAEGGQDGITPFEWFHMANTERDENGETKTVRTPVMNPNPNIDLNAVKNEIERYFSKLANDNQPANAITKRNEWVETISNNATWEPIADCIAQYFETLNDHTENYESFMAKLDANLSAMRRHVMRFVFNIKAGGRTVDVTNGLKTLMASPYIPFNVEDKGRLRRTSGSEGSVTKAGKELLYDVPGKVINSIPGKDGNTYTVEFDKKTRLPVVKVTDQNREDWIAPGLVKVTDSDNRSDQYSVWVGIEFCTKITDEGLENTFRRPEDMVAASNAGYINNPETVPGLQNITKEMSEYGKLAHSLSGYSADAIMGAVGKLDDKMKGQLSNIMSFTQSVTNLASKSESYPAFRGSLKVSSLTAPGKSAGEKAANIVGSGLDALADSVKRKYEDIVGGMDTSVMGASRSLVGFCASDSRTSSIDEGLLREYSVINELTTPVDTETGDASMVGLHTFTVSYPSKNEVKIVPNTDIGPLFESDEDIGELLATLETLRAVFSNIMVAIGKQISDDPEDAEQNAGICKVFNVKYTGNPDTDRKSIQTAKGKAYKTTLEYLESLADAYTKSISMQLTEETGKNLPEISVMEMANQPEFLVSLGNIIERVAPELAKAPDISDRTLNEVIQAADPAKQFTSKVAAARTPEDIAEINKATGEGFSPTVSGEEVADAVRPDILGERDDHTGDRLVSSIHKDALDNFDADAQADYSDVTDASMLGMIKCDPTGMHSGVGNFDILSGISPTELETVARALDSAHDEMAHHSPDEARGKNRIIREHYNAEHFVIDMAIDTFYNFMAKPTSIENRNVIGEANDVSSALSGVAADCQDKTMSDTINHMARTFAGLVNQVGNHVDEYMNDMNVANGKVEANRVAAHIISTAIANIVLNLESYNRNEMLSGDTAGLERHGSKAIGRPGTGTADLYTTAGSLVDPNNDGSTGTRSYSKAEESTRKKLADAEQYGLMDADEFATTLATIYQHVAMDQTIGFADALYPFRDLAHKIDVKTSNAYRNIYKGDSKNDLGAALIWAVVEDESSPTEGYPRLTGILSGLVSEGEQRPIVLPTYLFKGVSTSDGNGGGSLDFASEKQVTFTDNGVAKSVEGETEFDPGFKSLSDVGSAIGVDLDDGNTPEDVAKEIRKSVVMSHLDSSASLRLMMSSDKGTNTPVYKHTVASFIATFLDAAELTKSAGKRFVPLSVLYACIDNDSLAAAMQHIIDRSSNRMISKKDAAIDNRILSDVFGEEYAENIPENIDSGITLRNVVNALAGIATGTSTKADGIKTISDELGTPTETVAESLFNDYMKRLGGDVSGRSNAVLRNTAVATVTDALNSNSEFRNLYLEKNPTEANKDIQARKIMHGTTPLAGGETVNGIGGLGKLFDQVQKALDGSMDRDEAIEVLHNDKFKINNNADEGALKIFEDYFERLKAGIVGLFMSAAKGMHADVFIKTHEGQEIPRKYSDSLAKNLPGDEPLGTEGAGRERKLKLDEIEDVLTTMKSVSLKWKPKSAIQPGDDYENEVITRIQDWDTNSIDDTIRDIAKQYCMWDKTASAEEIQEKLAANKNTDNRVAAIKKLRDAMAYVFSHSIRCYERDVIPVIKSASGARGIGTDSDLSTADARDMLRTLVKLPESPIRKADSDMFGKNIEYYVDGKPASEDSCIAILRDAVELYRRETGNTVPGDDELVSSGFLNCIARCSSFQSDTAISSEGITVILLRTLANKKVIAPSEAGRNGYVTCKHRYGTRRGRGKRWYTFDIPLREIREIIEELVRNTELSGSANDWKAFADEVSKYTNRGNDQRAEMTVNPELRNSLWSMFRSATNTLGRWLDRLMNRLTVEQTEELVNAAEGVEIGEGVYARPSRIETEHPRDEDEITGRMDEEDLRFTPERPQPPAEAEPDAETPEAEGPEEEAQ